jgi:nitronate monooxygenase
MLSSMTSFTKLAGCRLPLQLAGMGGIGDAALASAVSDAGGLGMLGAPGLPPDALVAVIEQASSGTTGPFGVNVLMPFLDRDAVRVAATRVPVVEFFYGAPDAEIVGLVHDGGAIAGWQVGSLDEARAAVAAGCAYVVVQGAEAGGHVRGTQPLEAVLRSIVGAVDVPIVAAGGIGTAADVVQALDAGASAVRIGTRFVAATESCAHPEYVAALVSSGADDTVLTEAFSNGWPDAPHRVLRACVDAANAATEDVVGTMTVGDAEFPVPRLAPPPPTTSVTGNVAAMAQYAGTSVAAVRSRQPAAEIVAELCADL